MRIKDIEQISEYFDQQINSSSEMMNIFPQNSQEEKFFLNLQVINAHLRHDTEEFLGQNLDKINSTWELVEKKLNLEEEQLNTILSSAFILPPEYENIDIWTGIESKIKQDTFHEDENKPEETMVYSDLGLDWEILMDKSFELPENLQSLDIWESLNKKLNSVYHKEMFSDSVEKQADEKEKFFVGLSEFIDMEVNAEKAEEMNEHLTQCGSCRNYYLNFIRLRNILKESFILPENVYQSENSFWEGIEIKLFPEEKQNINKKRLI